MTKLVDSAPSEAKRRVPGWLRETLRFAMFLGGVFTMGTVAAQPFYIPSTSMMPALETGDRLVVSKYPYGWSFASPPFHGATGAAGRWFGRLPERGDVVVVSRPGDGTDLIKRVIGLPGDRLAVRKGVVFLNGVAVPRVRKADALVAVDPNLPCDEGAMALRRVTGADGRAWCRLPVYRETLPNGRSYDTVDLGDTDIGGGYISPGDNFAEVTVPADHVFLMGDNRDNSADSRFALARGGLGGPVPWENLVGRAEFVSYSLNGTFSLDPRTWPTAFRSERALRSLRPATD